MPLQNKYLTCLITLFLISQGLFAQNTESVIDNYFKVIGERNEWRGIKNMVKVAVQKFNLHTVSNINAALEGEGEKISQVILYDSYPSQSLTESYDAQGSSVQCKTMEGYWMKKNGGPVMNMTDSYLKGMETKTQNADFTFTEAFVFLDYANKKSHSIEYAGTETLNQKNYEVLRVVINDGRDFFYYFNTESKLLEYKMNDRSDLRNVTYFSNYKLVGELLFPFTEKSSLGEISLISEISYIELNSDVIRPELFDLKSDANSFLNVNMRKARFLSKLKKD